MSKLENKLDEEECARFVNEGYFTVRRSDKFWSGVWTDMTIEQTLMRSMKTSGGLTHGRGITDSVLGKWIIGGPFVLNVLEGLENLCGEYFESAEQHKDSRDSHSKRDTADCKKLDLWFATNPPFPVIGQCMSIASGIVGDGKINCYDAYSLGCKTLKKISGKKFGDVKLSRKDRVQTLAMVHNSFKFQDQDITADPLLLFQRISVCLKSQENFGSYFEYELSPYPLSLFDESGMRKTNKATLYSVFEKKQGNTVPDDTFYVIDGGWLLHRVVWLAGGTYKTILVTYISYVKRHFGRKCIIVFDGYSKNTYNTKAAERARRYSKKFTPDIEFHEDMNVNVAQENFLSNSHNKANLISLLMKKFIENDYDVKQADEDADRLIVITAIDCMMVNNNCAVVGEDVDLLVLLIAFTPVTSEILFLKPGKGKVKNTLYSSHSLNVKPALKNNILFLHAFSGCDCTSAIFGKGKLSLCKILQKREDLEEAAQTFKSETASQGEITAAGVKIFLALYGAKFQTESLNKHRFICFKKGILGGKKSLSILPPTQDAANMHCLRVYHQVQIWQGNKLLPQNWGWQTEPYLSPIRSTLAPAPPNVLESIFCGCLKGCGKACGCRKTGLKCSTICVHCSGTSCNNSARIEMKIEDIIDVQEIEIEQNLTILLLEEVVEDESRKTDDSDTEIEHDASNKEIENNDGESSGTDETYS